MRRATRFAAAALLLATLVGGCGHDAVAPVPISPPPPPIVAEVFPTARSERIFYGTPIWVRFVEPLDPLTVGDHTVFFKVDTRRIPCDVSWDATGRRIVIAPHDELELNTTHTVRLSTGIRTATGVALDQEISWQFKTMSLRFPVGDAPPAGAGDKGPWTTLTWRGSEAAAGIITYRVYAGTDSHAVAARGTPLSEPINPIYRPNPGWPLGATVYWTISAVNATTGEVVDGPVASFNTLAENTPVDSLDVQLSAWGYFNVNIPTLHPCYSDLITGNNYIAALRYLMTTVPPDLELAGARIDAPTVVAVWPFLSISNATLWAAQNQWTPCGIVQNFPTHDMELGELTGATVLTTGRLRFDGPAFVSYLQQSLPSRAPFELVVRSDRTVNYAGLTGGTTEARLHINYYRLPPAPHAALAREPLPR